MAGAGGSTEPSQCPERERVTPSIFISYRREDCPGHAGRLFDHLRARYGDASVFMDVTDIEAGVDFVEVLKGAVASCDVLIAVIGREWLRCVDVNGRRRLDDPRDFIRLEIGTALTRDVRVIPVLVEGAALPVASELPPELEGLTRRQAVELRDPRWKADVDSLMGVLDRLLGPAPGAEPPPRQQRRRARRWGFAAIAIVLMAAAAATAILAPRDFWSGSIRAPQSEATPAAPAPAPTLDAKANAAAASQPAAPTPDPAPATPPQSRAPDPEPPRPEVTSPPVPAPAVPAAAPSTTRGQPPVGPAARGRGADADVAPPDPGSRVVTPPGRVLIYFAADEDESTAEDLAAELRRSLDATRYVVRPLKTPRGIGGEGEVRYSGTDLSPLAGTLAARAGSWLSRSYGQRVAFTPTVESRVAHGAVILIMPGRRSVPSAPAAPVASSVVTIVYAMGADPTTAEELASFLRTRPGSNYVVRTVRASTGPRKEGWIEYDNDPMAAVAQALAREASPWISRAYGRRVVLQPILTGRIGENAVYLWLPSR